MHFPQGRVPCPLLRLEEEGEEPVESKRGIGGGEEVKIFEWKNKKRKEIKTSFAVFFKENFKFKRCLRDATEINMK